MSKATIPGRRKSQAGPLKGSSQDFGKLGSIGMLEHVSWAKIPTYYYDFRRFDLPLTEAEVNREFGRNIRIFDNQGVDPGGARQTNAAVGTGVNEAFVALGAGIVAMGEGEGFSIHGAVVPTPEAPQNTPVLVPNTVSLAAECYCGSVDLRAQPETTRLATLWWGAPTWRFIEKFFQAYRLQVIINARFQIVDESLFDVGMTPVPPEFVGASDSMIPSMPFINAVNGVMLDKDVGQQFLPANTITIIEGDNVPMDVATSECVPPPLAGVTYGHPRIIGLANRIYCFNQPILFIPGMRFEVDFFNVEDISIYTALRNSITFNCSTAGDRFLATGEDFRDPAAPGAPSLEVAPGATTPNCGINCTVPGGSVSLGVVFKGFALWPQAAVEYLANYLVPNSMHASMYSESNSSYLSGLLASADYDAKLRSQIAGNLGMTPDKVRAIEQGGR